MAEAGATPNSSTSIGVISEPPPTPVMPTMMPTPKPASEFSQFNLYVLPESMRQAQLCALAISIARICS
jgi:hypothetical protein